MDKDGDGGLPRRGDPTFPKTPVEDRHSDTESAVGLSDVAILQSVFSGCRVAHPSQTK